MVSPSVVTNTLHADIIQVSAVHKKAFNNLKICILQHTETVYCRKECTTTRIFHVVNKVLSFKKSEERT